MEIGSQGVMEITNLNYLQEIQMDPRFITKSIHALLDYPVAIVLMAAPFLLKLGSSSPIAFWLSLVIGIAALVLTLLTDHKLGALRVLPYSLHLTVDGMVGMVFLVAPFVFGFSGLDAIYYWANGIAVMCVVALHKPEPEVLATHVA